MSMLYQLRKDEHDVSAEQILSKSPTTMPAVRLLEFSRLRSRTKG